MNRFTLGDVAHVVMGQSPDGSTYNKQGVGLPLLNGPAEFGTVSPVAVQWTSEPSKVAVAGDILFCVRGNTLGRQNLADKPYAIGRGLAAIRGREGKADTEFIGLWLRFQATALLAAGTGSTFPNISADYLEKRTFPPIGITEQRRITSQLKSQLAAVDEARQAAKAQLNDAQRLIPAILESAFAETLDAEMVRIGEVARSTSGTTPSRSRKDYWDQPKYPWVKTGEINFSNIFTTEECVSQKAIEECSLPLLPAGTVLIAMYGQGKTRGQSAVLTVQATVNQACFAILPNETFDSEYLHFWLRYSYETLRTKSEARGGNQSNLNGEMLKAFEVPLISRSKQEYLVRKIKSSLSGTIQLQTTLEKQRDEVERLPAHLLRQAFEEN